MPESDATQRFGTSASRLIGIIESVLNKTKDNDNSLSAWASILGTSTLFDRSQLVSAIFEIGGLPKRIEAEFKTIPDIKHELYLSWVPVVSQTFETYLDLRAQMSHFRSGFKQPWILSNVKICDDLIRKQLGEEPVLDESRRVDVLKQVRSLIKELQTGQHGLSEVHLRFCLRHLMVIERALVEYQFEGFRACAEAVETVMGVSALRRQDAQDVCATQMGQRFRIVVGAFVGLVTTAAAGTVLLDWTDKHVIEIYSRPEAALESASVEDQPE